MRRINPLQPTLPCSTFEISESSDDGILTGLLFGPLIASAMLYTSLRQTQLSSVTPSNPLLVSWRIEPPAHLVNPHSPSTALGALVLSRYNLVNLATFCSTLLLFQVCVSWWFESRCRGSVNAPASERFSVPRSEARRACYYVLLTAAVSLGVLCARVLSEKAGLGVWQRTFGVSWFILLQILLVPYLVL